MTSRSQQDGFLMMIAAALIVVLALVSVSVTRLFVTSNVGVAEQQASTQALYLAESGLEETSLQLREPDLNGGQRVNCASVNVGTTTLGAGEFNATNSGSAYVNTTLSSAIGSGALTNIPLASSSGFASDGGRVMIGRELFNYQRISGNNLQGVSRGLDSSVAVAHLSGARVAQFQCQVRATGYVPNSTSPIGQRGLQQSVQLQEAWVVGDRSGNQFVLHRWNRPTELQWQDASFNVGNVREDLLAVSMLNYADGFTVGNERNNQFTIRHWNGSSWVTPVISSVSSNQYIQDLNGVSSVSDNEAWAVGASYNQNPNNRQYTILYWNGATWCLLGTGGQNCSTIAIPAPGSAARDLYGVHVVNTATGRVGFAVGDEGRILQLQGSGGSAQWVRLTPQVNNRLLYSVFVVSASEAWAVGNQNTLLRWNGTSWSSFSHPDGNQALRSIYMLDTTGDGFANYGWAVGNNGRALRYDGGANPPSTGTWSVNNDLPNNPFSGVALFGPNDAWTVGTGGRRYHWNGVSWQQLASGGSDLNGISIVGAKQNAQSAWREVFS